MEEHGEVQHSLLQFLRHADPELAQDTPAATRKSRSWLLTK